MLTLDDAGSAVLGLLYAYRVPAAILSAAVAVVIAVMAWRLGWFASARRHPRTAAAVLVPILAIALPVGWYLASPLVVTASIDEPAPAVVVPVGASASASAPIREPSGSSEPGSSLLASPSPSAAGSPVAPKELVGTFAGTDDFYFGRGTARLIETSPGAWVVRLEEFAVRNGPDLYVYLSPSREGFADGAIELGRLKADRGNQNYPLPEGALTDTAAAGSVVIWCKQFSHLFATAPLATR